MTDFIPESQEVATTPVVSGVAFFSPEKIKAIKEKAKGRKKGNAATLLAEVYNGKLAIKQVDWEDLIDRKDGEDDDKHKERAIQSLRNAKSNVKPEGLYEKLEVLVVPEGTKDENGEEIGGVYVLNSADDAVVPTA